MRERVSRNERRKEKQNILPGDIMTFSREVFASDSSLVLVLPKPEFTAPSKRIDSNNTNLAADLGLIKQKRNSFILSLLVKLPFSYPNTHVDHVYRMASSEPTPRALSVSSTLSSAIASLENDQNLRKVY